MIGVTERYLIIERYWKGSCLSKDTLLELGTDRDDDEMQLDINKIVKWC